MTQLIKIERGVEVENKDSCLGCKLYEFSLTYPGYCNNKKSNHYKHYICSDHPACKCFERKE